MRAGVAAFVLIAGPAWAALRIMPPDGTTLAAGQRFDVLVEAKADRTSPPAEIRVFLDGRPLTARGAAPRGEDRGARRFLHRGLEITNPGEHVLAAESGGRRAEVRLSVGAWQAAGAPRAPRAKNVILLLGDGMGAAHRTAARVVSRGYANGKALRPLAMDTMPVTGLVMTASLDSVITDSSPGMAAYVTGAKSNNKQQGVFPDDTKDAFDNPRVEYLSELLRRTRGPGFRLGIVTTADVTDSTPAGNAVHTADRNAGRGIAEAFFAERDATGLAVLLGGGSRHFAPPKEGGRDVARDFEGAGYTRLNTGTAVKALLAEPHVPARLLGLFHPRHLPVAFDKVGAGRYSDELAQPSYEGLRDQPMLDDLARLALRALADAPDGFYLMIEGASIDKRSHAADTERMIWDTIELDNAVAVALEFARKTNGDADPGNDTLVIVTADHECGGAALVAVGNERYAPQRGGSAVRDYAATFRFTPDERGLFPTYAVDAAGYPVHPDPATKLLLGWAAAPDRYENWVSNRRQREAAVRRESAGREVAVANADRDGPAEESDNRTVEGRPVAGFHVTGVIENGAHACRPEDHCPGDTSSEGQTISGHTGTDVPLSAEGAGAWQFTGTFANTDVLLKILRAAAGTYPPPGETAPPTSSRRSP